MAKRPKPNRMTAVPATAFGSGAKVTDLFPLPVWMFCVYRTLRWCVRHWYLASLLLVFFIADNWGYFLAVAILSPMTFMAWIWYHNRTRSFTAVLRASWRLFRTRMKWKHACESAELNEGPKRPRLFTPNRPPKIANHTGNALTFTLNLARMGLTVRMLEDNKDYVVASLNARRARIQRVTPGIARFTIEWEKNIFKSTVAHPTNQINDTQLPRISLDQDVLLELDTSLLVVGESGSGKSNLTWVILNELNKLVAQDIVQYRLYVIDPKKVELAELIDSPHTVAYSDEPGTADELIERFYTDMMSTFARMKKAGIRKAPLTTTAATEPGETIYPLNILIIDELLLTKQARQGIDTHLGEILSAGRAAGYIVIGDSQLGQVDALSRIRDLFPQRICMAVKSADLTSAVLGPKAEERGARCTEITEKGVGYIYTDFAGTFQRFLPAYIDDVQVVANGSIWFPRNRLGRKAKTPRVNPWGK